MGLLPRCCNKVSLLADCWPQSGARHQPPLPACNTSRVGLAAALVQSCAMSFLVCLSLFCSVLGSHLWWAPAVVVTLVLWVTHRTGRGSAASRQDASICNFGNKSELS